MRRRVVVTGIGYVTPLGTEIETVWRRLLNGDSGVGYITLFDASNFPTKISAEVRNWDLSDVIYTLECLFMGRACPETVCASDANNDGAYDLSDAVFTLLYLFAGGREPAPCE